MSHPSSTAGPSRSFVRRSVSALRASPKTWVSQRIGDLVLIIIIVALVVPFLITVSIALRPAADVAANPLGIPTHLTLDNLVRTFGFLNYGQALINTVIYAGASTFFVVLLGGMASYPIARLTRRWTTAAYRYFIIGTTVPIFVLIAPLYLLMRDLGLLDTRVGVVIIYVALNFPMAIFFFSNFLRTVPEELEDAAEIDGAGPFRTFFAIVLPLMRPVIATLSTFLIIGIWNDLVVPLIFTQDPSQGTIMSNAFALIDPKKVDPTTMFPAVLLGVAPLVIVFFLLQRYLVSGISTGAVK